MSARLMLAALLAASALSLPVQAQAPAPATAKPLPPGQTAEPFTQRIVATEGVITVRLREFAALPDIDNIAARAMTLVEEPGTRRLFVSDMRGPLYAVSMDGRNVTPYLEHQRFGISVQSVGRERGVQSIAFHPQFAQVGAPGYGKF